LERVPLLAALQVQALGAPVPLLEAPVQ